MAPLTRRALVAGISGALAAIHVSLVGIVGTFQTRELISGVVNCMSSASGRIGLMFSFCSSP